MLFSLIIFSSLAGLSTIFGVYLIRHFENFFKKNVTFLISFAIGILLATAFFHLLPESINLTPNGWFYWVLGAIILLYLIEHLTIIHFCQEEECEIHAMGAVSLLGIGIHSLIDGIIIGVGFKVSFIIGFLAASAVIFHETAEGIIIYTLLIEDKTTRNKALFYSWLVALATPLGAILTFLFIQNISAEILGWLIAFSAGSFIYIGASDLIPETHRKYNFLNIFLVLLGIIFVFVIGKFLG